VDERRGAGAEARAAGLHHARDRARDDGLSEVEMTDANGIRVEACLDPVTGEPVERRDRDW
jgi:hypothetical protein